MRPKAEEDAVAAVLPWQSCAASPDLPRRTKAGAAKTPPKAKPKAAAPQRRAPARLSSEEDEGEDAVVAALAHDLLGVKEGVEAQRVAERMSIGYGKASLRQNV